MRSRSVHKRSSFLYTHKAKLARRPVAAKEEEDGEVDLEYLASCRRRKHLGFDPEPIPEAYLNEREENDQR